MCTNQSFESRFSRGIGVAAVLLISVFAADGQSVSKTSSAKPSLQEHYDAAESFQEKGDLAQAALHYKLFLAEALHRVANGRAQVGEYQGAVTLFDEARTLDPKSTVLGMDYAKAALDANDPIKAQHLAQELIDASPMNGRDSRTAKLHWLFGQALLDMDDNAGARDQFAAAVAISPTFENRYALAQAYLAMLDKDNAAKLFGKMLAEFGDTAQIHMDFGPPTERLIFRKKQFWNSGRHLPEMTSFLMPTTRWVPLI
jgi:tetratricopeptide (TPR) repeat protein